MTNPRRSGGSERPVQLALASLVILVAVTTGVVMAQRAGTTTTTTTSTTTTSTTTTIPRERAQAHWTVASSSARGVMVDYRNIAVAGVVFRALRLHARTTLLRWHVGSTDPNLAAHAPLDAGPSIYWPSEGLAGVVAVFNGGFKQSAQAGGSVVDGFVLVPLVRGYMTVAIDAAGHWAMGVWGAANFPPRGFHAISYRQNLAPLVLNGAPTPTALSANWGLWGSPLGGVPPEPRSALGVDARGNLIYVATMTAVLAAPLARALVAAGAVRGMELDINPFWPVLGASFQPVHSPAGAFPVQLPLSSHSPTIFESGGWSRDFFVALAEPNSWSCNWTSQGLAGRAGTAQPQRLTRVGAGCTSHRTITTTTSSTTTTTTTTTTPVGATGVGVVTTTSTASAP